jgi:hypothetical protein
MENQVTAHAMPEEDTITMRILYGVGVVTLMFGPVLTGNAKGAIVGVAILVFCALF